MSAPRTSPRSGFIADLPADEDNDVSVVYTGAVVSLSTMRQALVRRRWWWLLASVLGLCIGASFHLVVPTSVTAVADAYLTEPAAVGGSGITNDMSLFETNMVAVRALGYLANHRHLGRVGSYTVRQLGSDIVQLRANASDAPLAVEWTDALMRSFFNLRDMQLNTQTAIVVNTLDGQRRQLSADVRRLTRLITAINVPNASPRIADQIGLLVSERAADQGQIEQIATQVAQDLLDQKVVVSGSSVIDPAVAAPFSQKKVFAMDGLTGLVGGSVLTMGLIVVGSIVSDRPRRRAQIAASLGAPVELTVPAAARPRWSPRARHLRAARPDQASRLVISRLQEHVERSEGTSLAVVALDRKACVAAAQWLSYLAYMLAKRGRRVALVDMADGRPLAKLLGARRRDAARQSVRLKDESVDLIVAPVDLGAMRRPSVAEISAVEIVLATLDPATGAEHLSSVASAAVVILCAGAVTQTRIESIGHMLRDSSVPPRSAIVIGVGNEDESYGGASEI